MVVKYVPRTNDGDLNSLLSEWAWADGTLTFGFPTIAAAFADYESGEEQSQGFAAFNIAQQAAVRDVLGQIADFTLLDFTESTGSSAGNAILRFGRSDAAETAYAYLPSSLGYGGDSWYTKDALLDAPSKGNFAFYTILHEVGHALGLLHPFEGDGQSVMSIEHDGMAFTVMSYSSVAGSQSLKNAENNFATGYMLYDIAALQTMYGANYATNAGDTKYKWNPETGEMLVDGVGQGRPAEAMIFQTVWDGGGIDTYDFSNMTESFRIDLRPGNWTRVGDYDLLADLGGVAPGNIANAFMHEGNPASLIENVIGTDLPDKIHGNEADNHLMGGDGYDSMYGYGGDDRLVGGLDDDRMYGGDGADRLDGSEGHDWMYGENGDDILKGGEGGDLLLGDAGNDTLLGGTGNDQLLGGENDDYLAGEDGNDKLKGDGGDDRLFGGGGNDHLEGGEGADILHGGDGDDTLIGGAGADRLEGGSGDDTYYFDDPGDTLVEFAGGGYDRLYTSFAVMPGHHIDAIYLSGTDDLELNGNYANNYISGNDGDNLIDGRGGRDSMRGGDGDDIYIVDDPEDYVLELAGGGYDTVYASVSYTLPEPRVNNYNPYASATMSPAPPPTTPIEIEALILTGTADIDGTGNQFDNSLVGNSGSNILSGLEGNDRIDGGAGADTMYGGAGDDVFIVDHSGDRTYDQQGFNTVESSASFALRTGIDTLVLTGSADISGKGNATANRISGNSGDNRIDGGEGADTMLGGLGDDTYIVDDSGDRIIETSATGGFDTVKSSVDHALRDNVEALALTGTANLSAFGNSATNWLYGNSGNNRLDGKEGADTMSGGLGDDLYIVDNSADRVIERAGSGFDTVKSTTSFGLSAHIEVLALSGSASIGAFGNASRNWLYGNEADNTLRGNGGDDVMRGNGGDDLYLVSETGDRVFEKAGDGFDTVRSDVTFGLSAHVEVLSLTGSAAINGYGNAQDNWIYGNAADNLLSGNGGADVMKGGDGDDTYLVENIGDVVIENGAGGGFDVVKSWVDYALGADIEVLALQGSAHLAASGNSAQNWLYGNSGNNVLSGGKGDDVLSGGSGNDVLAGGRGADRLVGGEGADQFRFDTAIGGGEIDRLDDFTSGVDKIVLDAGVFSALQNGNLAAGQFRLGTQALDADDRLIFDPSSGHLFYDPDGNGNSSAVLFGVLAAGTGLTWSDFVIL